MKWAELSKKERGRLLVARVMGCFVLESESADHRVPDFPMGLAGFRWPIAFWNATIECWMIKDVAKEPRFFDPLSDLRDAWEIVTYTRTHMYTITNGRESSAMGLFIALEAFVGTDWWDIIDDMTPERLCVAVLCAIGENIEA